MSNIIASVKGVGPLTKGVQLITSTGDNVCQYVNIYKYGVVECKTWAKQFPIGPLSVKLGGQIYPCVGPTGACNYSTSTSMPLITALTKKDSQTLSLVGYNFILGSNYQVKVKFVGIFADTVIVGSATAITAIFNKGLPISSTSIKPELIYYDPLTNATHWSNNWGPGVVNAINTTTIDSNISCSFAGGCLLSIS